MARTTRPNRIWYLALIGASALLLVSVLVALRPSPGPITWFIRGAALLGYLAIFFTIASSAYMREMLRWFGRPFIRVHHVLSVAGLILITLHPLGVALDRSGLGVFVPTVDSWLIFFTNGGRPAWYLIGIASLAALLRTRIGQRWKLIHYLNYLAFWLASVHAFLLGEDVQLPAVRIVFIVAALAVIAIFIQKRLEAHKRKAARQKPK